MNPPCYTLPQGWRGCWASRTVPPASRLLGVLRDSPGANEVASAPRSEMTKHHGLSGLAHSPVRNDRERGRPSDGKWKSTGSDGWMAGELLSRLSVSCLKMERGIEPRSSTSHGFCSILRYRSRPVMSSHGASVDLEIHC